MLPVLRAKTVKKLACLAAGATTADTAVTASIQVSPGVIQLQGGVCVCLVGLVSTVNRNVLTVITARIV